MTKISPAELMIGRQLKTKLPENDNQTSTSPKFKEAQRNDKKQKQKMKTSANARRQGTEKKYKTGDKVLVKRMNAGDKFAVPFFSEPCTVVKQTGVCVQLKTPEGKVIKRHSQHTKIFHEQKRERYEGNGSTDEKIQEDSDDGDGILEDFLRRRTGYQQAEEPNLEDDGNQQAEEPNLEDDGNHQVEERVEEAETDNQEVEELEAPPQVIGTQGAENQQRSRPRRERKKVIQRRLKICWQQYEKFNLKDPRTPNNLSSLCMF